MKRLDWLSFAIGFLGLAALIADIAGLCTGGVDRGRRAIVDLVVSRRARIRRSVLVTHVECLHKRCGHDTGRGRRS